MRFNPKWTVSRALAATVAVTFAGALSVAPAGADSVGPQARVDNPYSGAKVYVNPEWSAKAAAEPGGSRVSNQPTGVWLDRIAAIDGVNGGMGLRDHLDAALAQKGSGEEVVQLVVYDLPGR